MTNKQETMLNYIYYDHENETLQKISYHMLGKESEMTIFRSEMNVRISSREQGSSSLINSKVAPLEIFTEENEQNFKGTKECDMCMSTAVKNNFFVSYEEESIMSGLITPY